MVSEILTRIKSRLTLSAESTLSTDDLLESISRERRADSRCG